MGRSQRVKKVLFGEKQPDQRAVSRRQIRGGAGQEIRIIRQYDQKNNLSEKVKQKESPGIDTANSGRMQNGSERDKKV